MGCWGKTFLDCTGCVECLRVKPKVGRRSELGDLGRNKHKKIEREGEERDL